MWLIDDLLGSRIMCCYAAVHLTAVRILLSRERKAAENLARLRNVEGTARKLIKESNKKNKFVAALLSDYTPIINKLPGMEDVLFGQAGTQYRNRGTKPAEL